MDAKAVLADGFERVRGSVHDVLDGITPADLHGRLEEGGNTVAWLVWHLTRVQDDHIADAAGEDQVWTADGWDERFALPLPTEDTGFGHTPEEVASVRVDSPQPLLDYHDAVHARTVRYVRGLRAGALDEVVDDSWQPPVTLGVRLVSVLADDLQHVGQAAYVRGSLERP